MEVCDFSGNDFGNKYMTKRDYVGVLDRFVGDDGEISLKMLVADRRGKRMVFVVPSGEILQVKGYDDEAVKTILECAREVKDELIQAIEEEPGE